MKISELCNLQKSHMAWRIHRETCGMLEAIRIANGELGDISVYRVFRKCDCGVIKSLWNAMWVRLYPRTCKGKISAAIEEDRKYRK
jgi:hypothetical protein